MPNKQWVHVTIPRRQAIQAGTIGLLGLGSHQLAAFRAQAATTNKPPKAKSCIFIFLSGGLAQHESFDMKPDAPEEIRGEFRPIHTNVSGIDICEHLPLLAKQAHRFALVRSLTHPSNDHSAAHHIMLTGRTNLPVGFTPNAPSRADFASIAAMVGRTYETTNNLPPAIILPERLVHNSGRILPGQGSGEMGTQHEPWFIEASSFHTTSYGAFPEYSFDHQDRGKPDDRIFQAPRLSLPHGFGAQQLSDRVSLLQQLRHQQANLEQAAQTQNLDRMRQSVVSLLTDPSIQTAVNIKQADQPSIERYGNNAFGWSLLMARRLVSCGVPLIQVNLGNNETWDTHGNAFPHLKDQLLPPTDRGLSALLEDLASTGELDETLVVMAGEFGRTPKISLLPQHYKLPGRDHWGALQSVLVAGGGTRGGIVIGKSDSQGAYPTEQPVTPEHFAATIYHALGIPQDASWLDPSGRPHQVYHGEPIDGLF